jgi:hypothetical protein
MRVETFLATLQEPYHKMFAVTMQEDQFDLSTIGNPIVKSCTPPQGPHDGGIEIFINGFKFDRRLGGVYCRFGKAFVKATDVTNNRITVRPPPRIETGILKPDIGIEFEQGENHMTFIVNVFNKIDIDVFVTNRMNEPKNMSTTCAPFSYKDAMPSFILGPEIINEMEPLFSTYCKIDDPYNTGLMTLEKWKTYKGDMAGIEALGVQLEEPKEEQDDSDERESGDIDFYKFAQSERGGFKLNFQQFLMANVFIILTKMEEKHPVEFLIRFLQFKDEMRLGTKTVASENIQSEEALLWQEINSVLKRPHRIFDIYSGPVLVGRAEEKAGPVLSTANKILMPKHKFMQYRQYDANTESTVLKHISVAETFSHFIRRCIQYGFDVAASHQDPSTRTPVGRCWHIYNNAREKIGVLWDYPGQYSNLDWHPRSGELEHKKILLTIYDGNGTSLKSDFLSGYQIFNEADSIGKARDLIEKNGYRLRTVLYKAL